MTDSEKMIEATLNLKRLCAGRVYQNNTCHLPDGSICPMWTSEPKAKECRFRSDYIPDSWDVPKTRRFTDADIALAKIMKEFGASHICRTDKRSSCCVINESGGLVALLLPKVFANIDDGELFPIDDIIKEGKNQ